MYHNADFNWIVANYFFSGNPTLFSVLHEQCTTALWYLFFYSMQICCTQLQHISKYIFYDFQLWSSQLYLSFKYSKSTGYLFFTYFLVLHSVSIIPGLQKENWGTCPKLLIVPFPHPMDRFRVLNADTVEFVCLFFSLKCFTVTYYLFAHWVGLVVWTLRPSKILYLSGISIMYCFKRSLLQLNVRIMTRLTSTTGTLTVKNQTLQI